MYKNILVPIDPSHIEEADPAVELAEHMREKGGKITLLAVVEEIPTYVASQIPEAVLAGAGKNASDGLRSLIDRRGTDATALVKRGHAAATIKQVQQEQACDLIIISSHKPSTVDYVLGSTASKVVRRAQCPVFVMR